MRPNIPTIPNSQEELDECLRTLSQPELFFIDFFRSHKRLITTQEAEHFLPHPQLSDPFSRLQPRYLQSDSNKHASYLSKQYMEPLFFLPGLDIFMLKHTCCSPANIHQHEFFELCYVYEGHCQQRLYENNQTTMIRAHNLHTGDMLFLPPGQYHDIIVDSESIILNIGIRSTTFRHTFLNQLPDNSVLGVFFANQLFSPESLGYLVFHTNTQFRPYILDLTLQYLHPDMYTKNMLNLMLSILLLQLLRNFGQTAQLFDFTGLSTSGILPALFSYLEEHYADTNVQLTAKHFNYSPDHLNRICTTATGQNISVTLTKIRLGHACELLHYSNYSIEQISNMIGYEDVTNFIRNFKKYYDTTPGKYRKLLNQTIFPFKSNAVTNHSSNFNSM